MQNNPNNCCKGQFEYTTDSENLSPPFGIHFLPKKITGIINYKSRTTDENNISYPRNQRGRWNQMETNTKLFPVISYGRSRDVSITYDTYNCNGKKNISKKTYTQGPLVVQKQSGRLFKNTHPNMSKRQLYAYLSRNRKFLNR